MVKNMLNILELIRRLRFRYPLFTTTIEQLDFIEDYTLSTAATNGSTIYYNPRFMLNLTPDQQLFVLAHEVSHVALNHINRAKGKNMLIWNIATDAVINAFLQRDGLIPVDGMIFIDNALEYSSEELYKLLSENPIEENSVSIKGDKEESNSSHQKWSEESDDDNDDSSSSSDEKKSSKGKKDKNNKKEPSNGEDDSNSNNSNDKKENEYNDNSLDGEESKDETSGEVDERQVFEDNSNKRKENEKNLKKKISNGSGCSINEPGFDSPELKIKDIGKKSKLIDWRRLLKEACKLDLDYSFKDAQIEDGVLVSHLIEIPSCETEILLDTSGSIDHELLKCFLRECKNILQNSKIKVACFDDKVYEFVNIRTEYDLENMKFKGGGGTNFVAASNGFSNRVDNKIIFTDGCGYVSNPPLDIIWVVFETARNLPKQAKIIKVNREKLIKFNS